MIDEKEKTIDGVRFRVGQLPVEQAEDLLFDILKIVGPSLVSALEKALGKGGFSLASLQKMQLSPDDLTRGVRELADRFEKSTYHAIVKELAGVTWVQTGPKSWPRLSDTESAVFSGGKILLKWKWLGFALGVQYPGFFGGGAGEIGPKDKAAEERSDSKSRRASGGASGDS